MERHCIIPTLGANVANSVTDWRTAGQTHSRTPLQREDAMKQVWLNPPSGFGGDSVTDGRTDRQTVTFWPHPKVTYVRMNNNIAFAHHYHAGGGGGWSHVASLVEFRPVLLEDIVWWTDGRVRLQYPHRLGASITNAPKENKFFPFRIDHFQKDGKTTWQFLPYPGSVSVAEI